MRNGNLEFTDREPTDDEAAGIAWWNALPDAERALWLARAATAVPAQAWAAHKAAHDGHCRSRRGPVTSWTWTDDAR